MTEYLYSREAVELGEALNNLPNTAKARILETLKSDRPVAFQTWIYMPQDDNEEYCGCLLADGWGKDFDKETWRKWYRTVDADDDVMPTELAVLYGVEDTEALSDLLQAAIGRYDTFIADHYNDEWVSYRKEAWTSRYQGVLNRQGKDAVLAVFNKYVTVAPNVTA